MKRNVEFLAHLAELIQ